MLNETLSMTHLEVVPEDVLRQSVHHFMVPAENLPALSSEIKRVDHTGFQFPRQHVISVKETLLMDLMW